MCRVVVLIPAHNEEERIGIAIQSVWNQSHVVDRILVISDNSTDRTIDISKDMGVDVLETENNVHKKSGALNQALNVLGEDDSTLILIMDADSELSSTFVEDAIKAFTSNVGAVGGIFLGDNENGLIGDCQRLEYVRYAREISRNNAKAKVLTGTSTFTKFSILKEVKQARDSGVFSGSGFYNPHALTEDFEMTVCIKRLGYETISPKTCTVITETMPTIKELWKQRLRWQRGALQTLSVHGINTTTLPYVWKQFQTGIGILMIVCIWASAIYSIVFGTFSTSLLWIIIGSIFYLERVVTAWRGTPRLRVIASIFIVDFSFDLFISAVYVYSLFKTITKSSLDWGIDTIDQRSV